MYCPRCRTKLWKQERWGNIVIGYCQECMKKTSFGDLGKVLQNEYYALVGDEFKMNMKSFKHMNYEEQIKKAWRAVL